MKRRCSENKQQIGSSLFDLCTYCLPYTCKGNVWNSILVLLSFSPFWKLSMFIIFIITEQSSFCGWGAIPGKGRAGPGARAPPLPSVQNFSTAFRAAAQKGSLLWVSIFIIWGVCVCLCPLLIITLMIPFLKSCPGFHRWAEISVHCGSSYWGTDFMS